MKTICYTIKMKRTINLNLLKEATDENLGLYRSALTASQ